MTTIPLCTFLHVYPLEISAEFTSPKVVSNVDVAHTVAVDSYSVFFPFQFFQIHVSP